MVSHINKFVERDALQLYKEIGGNLQCLVCAHKCIIAPGKTGICGIRINRGGKIHLIPYGRGFVHVDPIEKKPLYHFYPGSKILSIGTVGCNFKCLFCQNYDISQIQHYIGIEKIIERFVSLSPKKVVNMAINRDLQSIAYTYTEPTVYFEYTYDIAKLAKKYKIKNVYVSNGYQSTKTRKMLVKLLDAINIDLKSFSNDFYLKIVGAKLDPVLKNIEYFYKHKIWVEITTLVIPGHNDSTEELRQIANFIANISKDIPWHISRFFPTYKMLNVPMTPIDTLIKAYEIGIEAGLHYVYIGNIPSTLGLRKYQNTYCPKCGNLLIDRQGYNIDVKGIEIRAGKAFCKKCGFKIAGRFSLTKSE